VAQCDPGNTGIIGIDGSVQPCVDHIHEWMSIQGCDYTGLIITGDTYLKGSLPFSRQGHNIVVFKDSDTMTDPFRPQFEDRFLHAERDPIRLREWSHASRLVWLP